MSVLDRDALSDSPLADLHAIASELGIDGYRRLKKDDLIDAILERQGGETGSSRSGDDEADEKPARRRRPRGGRGRKAKDDEDDEDDEKPAASKDDEEDDDEDEKPKPRRRARKKPEAKTDDADEPKAEKPAPRGRGRGRDRDSERDRGRDRDSGRDRDRDDDREETTVEGKLELASNGSGFVRASEGETSDEDVYVSAAQIRRCELVSGDVVAGPVRSPRRSERHPSLVRVDTINGKPADEVAGGTHYDELKVAWPAERIELGSEDPTLRAIEWLTPFGRGSRVTITGPTGAGKSEALRRLGAALAAREGLEVSAVLAGARPEEIAEWGEGPVELTGSSTFATAPDQQTGLVERAIEHGKRIAARGGDAVVLIDSLESLPPHAARRVLAAARNLAESGSLTIIAAAGTPIGGETTVIALDARLTGARSFPALDLLTSATLRSELLVGDAGAEAIAKARAEAASTAG
jgi:transcription termination factor Rho